MAIVITPTPYFRRGILGKNSGGFTLAHWTNGYIGVALYSDAVSITDPTNVSCVLNSIGSAANNLTGTEYTGATNGYDRASLTNLSLDAAAAFPFSLDFLADTVTWAALDVGTPASAVIFYFGYGNTPDNGGEAIALITGLTTASDGSPYSLRWGGGVSNGSVISLL